MKAIINRFKQLETKKLYLISSEDEALTDHFLWLFFLAMDHKCISLIDYLPRKRTFTESYRNYSLLTHEHIVKKHPILMELIEKLDLDVPIRPNKYLHFFEEEPFYKPYIFDHLKYKSGSPSEYFFINDFHHFLEHRIIDDDREREWIIEKFQGLAEYLDVKLFLICNPDLISQYNPCNPTALKSYNWSRNLLNTVADIFYLQAGEDVPYTEPGDDTFFLNETIEASMSSLKSLGDWSAEIKALNVPLLNEISKKDLSAIKFV